MEKQYFTLDEANHLIPYLEDKLREIDGIKSQLDHFIDRLEDEGYDIEDLLKHSSQNNESQKYSVELEAFGDAINDVMFDIQERGVILKDLEMGLIDFFSNVDGKEVFLCWKRGEPEISYYHGIKEGFSGRKSLFQRNILSQVTNLH